MKSNSKYYLLLLYFNPYNVSKQKKKSKSKTDDSDDEFDDDDEDEIRLNRTKPQSTLTYEKSRKHKLANDLNTYPGGHKKLKVGQKVNAMVQKKWYVSIE